MATLSSCVYISFMLQLSKVLPKKCKVAHLLKWLEQDLRLQTLLLLSNRLVSSRHYAGAVSSLPWSACRLG